MVAYLHQRRQTTKKKENGMIKSNSLKTKLAFCTAAAVSILCLHAQESGCDGPVFRPGSSSGGPCDCEGSSGLADCGGPITVIYDYYSCGGNTAQVCHSMSQVIGYTASCLLDWAESGYYQWQQLTQAWVLCEQANPGQCGDPPNPCNYGASCYEGTREDISSSAYAGSEGECSMAEIRQSPLHEKIAFLISVCPPA